MSGIAQYNALTWDHPRGYEPLDAAARNLKADGAELRIRWYRQSLEGFESHPVTLLAQQYDLVIIDHPCLGEVAAHDCFVPVDEMFSKEECENWRRATVGPSYSSYCYAGRQWALPLDAATQVCVVNPELIEKELWPKTWGDVLDLAADYPMVLSLAGPHALLSLFSICAQICGEPNLPCQDEVFDDDTWRDGYELLTEIYQRSSKTHLDCNPIGILDRMASGTDIAICPLIYGYVSYAFRSESPDLHRLVFIDAPRFSKQFGALSTIGGTGLAVSRNARVTDALLDHLRYLMSTKYQRDFAPEHGGQPSSQMAWRDSEVNAQANGFYLNTLETISNAWVRPRYKGYVEFQALGSALVRDALADRRPPHDVIGKIREMYNTSRARLA